MNHSVEIYFLICSSVKKGKYPRWISRNHKNKGYFKRDKTIFKKMLPVFWKYIPSGIFNSLKKLSSLLNYNIFNTLCIEQDEHLKTFYKQTWTQKWSYAIVLATVAGFGKKLW